MIRQYGILRWVESNGGPLILLPRSRLTAWSGSTGSNLSRQDDYSRACGVSGYVGLLGVANGQALILGDEPMPTTWVVGGSGHVNSGTIVRWIYADSEEHVLSMSRNLPELRWSVETVQFRTEGETLYLFDSSVPGVKADEDGALIVDLTAGIYQVHTALYQPDERTKLLLHRMEG